MAEKTMQLQEKLLSSPLFSFFTWPLGGFFSSLGCFNQPGLSPSRQLFLHLPTPTPHHFLPGALKASSISVPFLTTGGLYSRFVAGEQEHPSYQDQRSWAIYWLLLLHGVSGRRPPRGRRGLYTPSIVGMQAFHNIWNTPPGCNLPFLGASSSSLFNPSQFHYQFASALPREMSPCKSELYGEIYLRHVHPACPPPEEEASRSCPSPAPKARHSCSSSVAPQAGNPFPSFIAPKADRPSPSSSDSKISLSSPSSPASKAGRPSRSSSVPKIGHSCSSFSRP